MNSYLFLEVWSILKVVVWSLWSYRILSATENNLTSTFQFPLCLSCLIPTAEVSSPVLSKRDKVWTAEICWWLKHFQLSTNKARFSMDVLCTLISMLWHVFSSSTVSLRSLSWGGVEFCQRAFWPIKNHVIFVFNSIYVLYVLNMICACSHILESQKQKQLSHGRWSF